jgi:hypothetical protein
MIWYPYFGQRIAETIYRTQCAARRAETKLLMVIYVAPRAVREHSAGRVVGGLIPRDGPRVQTVSWPLDFVVTRHSRSKNGVASLAYVPATPIREAVPT